MPLLTDPFRNLFNRLPVAMLIVDPATRLIWAANTAATRLCGMKEDALLRKLWSDLFAARDPQVHEGRAAFADGEVRALLLRAPGGDVEIEARILMMELLGAGDQALIVLGSVEVLATSHETETQPSFRRANLNQLLAEVYGFMKPVLNGRLRRLVLDLPAQPVWAPCDRYGLRSVLIRLLEHAGRSFCHSRIRVTLKGMTNCVRIEIEETGKRLDPTKLPRTVRKSVVSDLWTDEHAQINLCRKILHAHRGHILQERSKLSGRLFVLTFPRALAASEAQPRLTSSS